MSTDIKEFILTRGIVAYDKNRKKCFLYKNSPILISSLEDYYKSSDYFMSTIIYKNKEYKWFPEKSKLLKYITTKNSINDKSIIIENLLNSNLYNDFFPKN